MKPLPLPFTLPRRSRRLSVWCLLLACATCLCIAGFAQDIAPRRERDAALPAVWLGVPAQQRVAALSAAELDASRLLMERLYGFRITSSVTVQDLALQSAGIDGQIQQHIAGITTTGEPQYREDGTVLVLRTLKLREVLETLTRTLRQQESKKGLVTLSDVEKVTRENRDTLLTAEGNSAPPGSAGLHKLQAKRAAELDAYRKLAERVLGLSLSSTTTVKDLVLDSDTILARCAALVKGAKPTAVVFDADGSCEVTMQLKVAEVIEVIRHYATGKPSEAALTKIERDYASKTFTEVGRGAPRPGPAVEAGASPRNEADAISTAYRDTELIIKRVIGRKVVVE